MKDIKMHGNFKDLTGQKFNKLTVIKFDRRGERRETYWLCECDCGNIKSIAVSNLTSGNTKSCGCLHREGAIKAGDKKAKDWTGYRFGRLTATKRDESKMVGKRKNSFWICRCDCGNIISRSTRNLLSGNVKSCGCIISEKSELAKKNKEKRKKEQELIRYQNSVEREQIKIDKINKIREKIKQEEIANLSFIGKKFDLLTVIEYNKSTGFICKCDCGNIICIKSKSLLSIRKSCGCKVRNLKHGLYGSRFHNIWKGMKKRCYQKNRKDYSSYGGKGIKLSDEWLNFINFKNDMYELYLKHVEEFGEEDTTIDRINSNGNYEALNCRWATNKEQANNTRRNKNK